MRFSKVCAGLLLAGSVSVIGAGCVSKPAETSASPATMPETMPAVAAPATPPATAPVVVTPAAPKAAPTHVLTKDEPYFKSSPAAGATPDGTLKSGTKVLVFIPGGMFTKVTTDDGAVVYVATEGLDPISKK